MLNVNPFQNTLATFQLLGVEIVAALEHSIKNYDPLYPHGKFLTPGGLRYAWVPETYKVAFVQVYNRGAKRWEDISSTQVRLSSCVDMFISENVTQKLTLG